jgi:hypothetical protein
MSWHVMSIIQITLGCRLTDFSEAGSFANWLCRHLAARAPPDNLVPPQKSPPSKLARRQSPTERTYVSKGSGHYDRITTSTDPSDESYVRHTQKSNLSTGKTTVYSEQYDQNTGLITQTRHSFILGPANESGVRTPVGSPIMSLTHRKLADNVRPIIATLLPDKSGRASDPNPTQSQPPPA